MSMLFQQRSCCRAISVWCNFVRLCHQKCNVFAAKQEEFHNELSEKMEQFRATKITMDDKQEIVSYIKQQNVGNNYLKSTCSESNISSNIHEQISMEFINDVSQYGVYHALSNPYRRRLNLITWYIHKYVDLNILPLPLSSQDALKYSKPKSIEYDEQLRFIPLGFDVKYYGNHSFITIANNIGGCYPILPNQNKQKTGKKLLLLDLDGSLIDYNVERPYLKQYLTFLSNKFEIGIHSTGYDMEDLIDEWNRTYCNGNIMYYICKSHKFLQGFEMNRAQFLHIDDTKGGNQLRWITIKQFNRYQREDNELSKLMEWLTMYHDFDGSDSEFIEMFPPNMFLQQE